MVCSPGRSGSTLLADVLDKSKPSKHILKSHLLPPKREWKGKIIFIYSDPDKAAESICHVSLEESTWDWHFKHVETSDINWLQKIGSIVSQTVEDNLLAYDALGTDKQLWQWLVKGVEKCAFLECTVLAVKYEHLWDAEVIKKIKQFCNLSYFPLPERKERGYGFQSLSEFEKQIRTIYNLGTEKEPRYAAYDNARAIWKRAPKILYFRLALDK